MAIRYPLMGTSFSAQALDIGSAIQGGWRAYWQSDTLNSTQVKVFGFGQFQPSALSRPGNLGTAYTGVWTENVTTPSDAHRPIPFKELLLAAAAGLKVFEPIPFMTPKGRAL